MSTDHQAEVRIEADPHMESAGAEIMALAWRLSEHPDFSGEADRVRDIGAWISMARMSDIETSLYKMIGALVGALRKRGVAFNEDLPMGPQFEAFLASLPDPLPGEAGYVDQNTLAPSSRRDTFEAEVDIGEVRTWDAGDGVPRAIARECSVRPAGGLAGTEIVYAEGDATARLEANHTRNLRLRSTGRALRVVV